MASATCANMPAASSAASVLAVRASICMARLKAITRPAISPTPGENSRAPSQAVSATAMIEPKKLGRRCAPMGAPSPPKGWVVITCSQ